MATLAISKSSLTGATPSFAAATAGGDTFANDGNAFLVVKNGDGSPHTVTVAAVTPCDFGTLHNAAVAVGAGAETTIGPFSVARFGRSPAITYSAVTSVTIAVVTE